MKRYLPNGIATQLAALLLGGIVVGHLIGSAIIIKGAHDPIKVASDSQILERIAAAVRIAAVYPGKVPGSVFDAMSLPGEHFWLDSQSAVGDHAMDESERRLAEDLQARVAPLDCRANLRFEKKPVDGREQDGPASSFLVSTQCGEAWWLNSKRIIIAPKTWWGELTFSILASTIPVVLVVMVFVRRITRPVSRLAQAAEKMGRGEAFAPLPVTGPSELRESTAAFNAMQERLTRFVHGRTRMLAAISHDFRTPITAMKLRAEMIEDEDLKAAMMRSLAEMRDMVDATLAFVREDAAQEQTRMVDLVALTEALAEDRMAGGHEVEVSGPERLPYRCRPTFLRRALDNIISNAIRYGRRARVALAESAGSIRITVDDDGPGIPDGMMEEVFEPFTRLEESRSTETGGVGLGLAIARSCIRSHGGEVTLSNRPGGGLRAEIVLP
ncbi:ATP-binding protein [Marinivivus vitaminiproducens]|uniref:ATP-binding protein n=1 Tax=Marinivivus vitaminiproducens TaxID=3035935 RepID=UPI0027AB811D|nr:ATP-binding protein [Geminicoccaceae bacterium SCSIO 64248]